MMTNQQLAEIERRAGFLYFDDTKADIAALIAEVRKLQAELSNCESEAEEAKWALLGDDL